MDNQFLIVSRSLFIGMSFFGKFIERIKAHCAYSNFFFENRAVYAIMWKYTVEPGRSEDNTTPAHCMLDT